MNTTIEDNNLYHQLLNSDEDDSDDDADHDNLCLISFEKLKDNYITLPCNHTFNYDALYDAITIQKKSYNPLNSTYLRINEVQKGNKL